MTGASYKSHHVDVVVGDGGGAVGRGGEDTHTFRSQSGCEAFVCWSDTVVMVCRRRWSGCGKKGEEQMM